MQGFYWEVPSPAAGKPDALWWYDVLAAKAASLRQAGFTAIWMPPPLKANSGGFSVGYDPFDDYDIGSKLQKGTVPTRYGSRAQLQRCVAMLRANGIAVYLDLVQNHRNGDDGKFRFRYVDAYGKPDGGRFPKNAGDFHPNVPQDPNVPLGDKEYQFGRDLAPVNGRNGLTGRALNNAGDWITRSLDVQGYRLDYVKGISSDWLRQFLDYGAMKGKFAVCEYYDGDLKLVRDYTANAMKNRASSFDFPLRGLLKEMCDSGGKFDMKRLAGAGLAGVDPAHAVTFVENHDTDRDSPVVRGKMLAYAYILTSEGYPSVFYRDYVEDKDCYHLKKRLDPLIFINRKLAAGKTQIRWRDEAVYVFERTGKGHLLVGLNDQDSPQTVRVQTGFGKRVRLVDYTFHAPDLTTDDDGTVTVTLPRNGDGDGYVCYAPWIGIHGIPSTPERVTQGFFAAKDLDIRPLEPGVAVEVGKIYPAAKTSLVLNLSFDTKGIFASADPTVSVLNAEGKQIASFRYTRANLKNPSRCVIPQTGWYTLRIVARSLPPDSRCPFRLTANYLAPAH